MIWSARIATNQKTVADMRSRMGIALDAVACNEVDHFAAWFAETMCGIACDCFYSASELFHFTRRSGRFGERASLLTEVSRDVRK